jgi:hypothetical protein
MLAPACERCGCVLDSAAVTPELPAAARMVPLPRAVTAAARPAGVLLGGLVMYASAKVGYVRGGVTGGMMALAAGGYLLLPFVPERVGASRTKS